MLVVLHCAVLFCAVLCWAVVCFAVLCCAKLWWAELSCAMLCINVMCCVVQCCVVLYNVVQCCAVLYCAVQCCSVLSCAALCCSVLWVVLCCALYNLLFLNMVASSVLCSMYCNVCLLRAAVCIAYYVSWMHRYTRITVLRMPGVHKCNVSISLPHLHLSPFCRGYFLPKSSQES